MRSAAVCYIYIIGVNLCRILGDGMRSQTAEGAESETLNVSSGEV